MFFEFLLLLLLQLVELIQFLFEMRLTVYCALLLVLKDSLPLAFVLLTPLLLEGQVQVVVYHQGIVQQSVSHSGGCC